jgi:hypothetical protein
MYGGMQSPYASLNLLPASTSGGSGLDLNSLSKSFFPSFSPSLYTPSSTEMFKKALQAISDPLSSLYGSSSSSLTSSAQSLTTPGSSFMSSLLRNQLVPPPPAPLPPIASNYNANTIPPSSTSIFSSSSKPSLLSTTSSSSTGGPSTSTAVVQRMPEQQKIIQRSLLNNSKGVKRIPDNSESVASKKYAMMVAAQKDPVPVPKNSSANVTILPENNSRLVSNGNRNGAIRIVSNPNVQQPKRVPSNSAINASNTIGNQLTSARTNAPYIRKTPSQLDLSKKITPATTTSNIISSPKTLTKQVTGAFQSATNTSPGRDSLTGKWVKPITKQGPVQIIQPSRMAANHQNRANAAQQMRLNTSNQQRVNKQIINLPKTTSVTPATSGNIVLVGGQKKTVDHIQKQLEKHQTSMTDATGVKNLQIPSGSANSVSIIKLPTKQVTPMKVNTQNSGNQQASIAITPIARAGFNASAKKTVEQQQVTGPKIRGSISGNKIVISPEQLRLYQQDQAQQQQQKMNHHDQQQPKNLAPIVLGKKPSNVSYFNFKTLDFIFYHTFFFKFFIRMSVKQACRKRFASIRHRRTSFEAKVFPVLSLLELRRIICSSSSSNKKAN